MVAVSRRIDIFFALRGDHLTKWKEAAMARPPSAANLNIAQLQRALQQRQSELQKLHRKRAGLERKLNALDRHIERVGGGGMNGARRAGGGRRARNAQSLLDVIEGVLRGAGKPMKVADIMDGVLRAGYHSTSDNFRGIINQTLIKDKRFGAVERGVYELKSGAATKKKATQAKAE
jgi:hypothetical protein